MYTPAEKILLVKCSAYKCVRVGAVGTGGSAGDGVEDVGWRGSLVWVTQTTLIKYTQSDANLPLKYTKLIGVEGHVHKQTLLIKCALRRSKYSQFSGLKWEKGAGWGVWGGGGNCGFLLHCSHLL